MSPLYPWLTQPSEALLQQLSVGRLPHALLFLGAKGLGKSNLLTWLAERLLCQQPSAAGACGGCKSCQLLNAGTHPDLVRVETDKASIGVELIRQAIQALSETAHQQGARVVIIEQAQLMTESAANALLKTLEEPGQECFLLLSAESNAQLLPTINSRCQTQLIVTPDEPTALRWLQQQGCEATPAHLRLNRGSPLATQQFVAQGLHQRLDAFLVRMLAVLKGTQPSVELIAEAVKDQPHSLSWLSALLLDIQKATAGAQAEHLMFSQHWAEINRLAEQWHFSCPDWSPWFAKWQRVFQAAGLNQTLQWQALLSELRVSVQQHHHPLKQKGST